MFSFLLFLPASLQLSGRKVDAKFVKDAYNHFLGRDGTPSAILPKKPQTKEEKREECRKKGIFVAADDKEMDPTVFELLATGGRPARFKDETRPLRWKKPDSKLPRRSSIKTKKAKKKSDKSEKKKGREVIESSAGTESENSKKLRTQEKQEPQTIEAKEEPKPKEIKVTTKKKPSPPLSQAEPIPAGKSPHSPVSLEQATYTLREPVHTPKASKEKEADFGKFDDEEFEKILQKEQAKIAEADRQTVLAARKILRVASREKAFEKVLTREENEILISFFSGKIPYNQKVLQTLDRALDKTINFIEAKNIKLSNEIREIIEQRAALKRALFAEFLINPQYIPKTWAKKYEELRVQSKIETEGVNWARLILCYPTQKSFGDGPVDQYGNFTRRKRHWLLAALLGPSDSKTFAETQREELCRGMYFDPIIMEKAKKHNDEDPSLQ